MAGIVTKITEQFVYVRFFGKGNYRFDHLGFLEADVTGIKLEVTQ